VETQGGHPNLGAMNLAAKQKIIRPVAEAGRGWGDEIPRIFG